MTRRLLPPSSKGEQRAGRLNSESASNVWLALRLVQTFSQRF